MATRKPTRGSAQEPDGLFSRLGDKRVIAIAVLALVIVVALWPRKKDAPPAKASPEDSAQADNASPGTGFMGNAIMPVASGAPVAPPKEPDPPPVIDEIDLEKTEVCSGEENLISIKAHTVNGSDEFLHYVVDGKMGSSVPLTLWLDDNGHVQGQHTVTVFGRGNVATTQPLPQYTVKPCRPKYIGAIQQRVRSNTWADFDFNARVIAVPAAPTEADRQRGAPAPPMPKPFKAVSYSWNYGDGESDVTLGPITQHSYEARAQSTLYSYFVIAVTIRGAKPGETATARVTLPLMNPSFEALSEKKIIQLLISLDPRFPVVGSDGKVTQHVRIWHNYGLPVTVDRAVLVSYYRHAAGETRPQEVDVGSVLGTATIPPGKDGITTTVTLDPDAEEEVFSKSWSLEGTSTDGVHATGTFSVMLPPPKPGPDSGAMVFDPMMKQKIMIARQMLGKDVVDDEDLWALERQGAFANLKADPAAVAAARAQANAAMKAQGYPSPQPPYIPPGPAVPQSTSQQLAPPNQGGTAPAASK